MPAPPASASDFVRLAQKSGVLDEQKLAAAFPDLDELPPEPRRCANALIRAGLLTNFQARQLLKGRYRGFLLGPYRVLKPVGEGGMGVVYLAEHVELGRRVALKILPQEKARDRLSFERFHREARSAAALDHPNIVRLHDISQGAGVHFLVMEYVDGCTLQDLIVKTGPLHFLRAAHYIAQAAAGLQHAHDRGLVHRDIKPANLMVTRDGKVKILDMGLTRSVANAMDNLTAIHGTLDDVAGTVDFISPEQALNAPVDARSDLYSLGATFFALLTGRPPFTGNTAQKLMQHQLREPPSINKLRAVVPPGLADVVARMMAKLPKDRYRSGDEVIDALAPWLPARSTGNIVTRRSALGLNKSGWTGTRTRIRAGLSAVRRTKWWVKAVAAGIVLVAAGGIALAVVASGKSSPPETRATGR